MVERGSHGHRVVMGLGMPFWPGRAAWATRQTLDPSRVDARGYVAALRREALGAAPDYGDCRVGAVMVGGGVAAHVADDALGDLLFDLRRAYRLGDRAPDPGAGEGAVPPECRPAEVTVRALAGAFSASSLDMCRRGHVTRLELDYATSSPAEASALGWPMGPEALEVTREVLCGAGARQRLPAWLDVILRLLVGIPGQTARSARASVEAALGFGASGVSLRAVAPGRLPAPREAAEEVAGAMAERLGEAGMREYLPGEWALPGHECAFRVLDARGAERLGFGLGSLTRFDGAWARDTADLATYLRASDDPRVVVAEVGSPGRAPGDGALGCGLTTRA